ncbi:SDR family NAD(P)-dependent oxidoreductase [Novosphingobium sp. 9]|uniref:SDR family NAD(P)-dependent oxidoreductase n=1 Tax=Novosphingobium sp. 9 TaxID=2025349 RepID=UPI0021B67E37|nr:SDR family oxidoreductase [Novosphingobium sp. 9]
MSGALKDKVVLIIGGTSGFGLEVAHQAAGEEARLLLVGRNEAKVGEVLQRFRAEGVGAQGAALDATESAALEAFLVRHGPVDHLVSTVGGAMGGGFLSAEVKDIRETVEGKVFAAMTIARATAPYINDGGSMTFTGGSGGRPDNASGAYLGNIGIAALVRGLGVELAGRNIRANAVAPTWTPTPLWRDMAPEQVEDIRASFASRIPLGRVAQVPEIAEAYLFLMRCTFITGQTLTVDGGLTLVE